MDMIYGYYQHPAIKPGGSGKGCGSVGLQQIDSQSPKELLTAAAGHQEFAQKATYRTHNAGFNFGDFSRDSFPGVKALRAMTVYGQETSHSDVSSVRQ